MKTIHAYKAQPLGKTTDVEDVKIIINKEIPHFVGSLREAELVYEKEAEALADALFKSLPQGTMDRLLIEIMKKNVSSYRGITNS